MAQSRRCLFTKFDPRYVPVWRWTSKKQLLRIASKVYGQLYYVYFKSVRSICSFRIGNLISPLTLKELETINSKEETYAKILHKRFLFWCQLCDLSIPTFFVNYVNLTQILEQALTRNHWLPQPSLTKAMKLCSLLYTYITNFPALKPPSFPPPFPHVISYWLF